eukprot:TRINITY_DN3169_c0_g1_i1.p1 TRINITY_DN3169_c0_g1~~TRINITY_DN3169_c0_g1_i1.p1  ORF type:complete len:348 (-),score=91.74 TRINITY_DN3169_c0_g1_i1:4-1002(-)
MANKGGKVFITVLHGSNLPSADSNGLSDPYVKIIPPGSTKGSKKLQTKVVKKSLNPSWNEQFEVEVRNINQKIRFEVYDWDRFGKDDALGFAEVALETLLEPANTPHPLTLPLSEKGTIKVEMTFIEADLVDELGAFAKTKFMRTASSLAPREYILIVDKSGSMAGSLWRSAEKAVKHLAPYICKADPNGITLYFFTDSFVKYDNVQTAHDVEKLFSKEKPSFSTNLTDVLKDAFSCHFKVGKPSTILVITDGSPDNQETVMQEIRSAANGLQQDSDLSITFVQIGRDPSAESFLKKLDDSLGAKFDIVDTVTQADMEGMDFDDMISRSIND